MDIMNRSSLLLCCSDPQSSFLAARYLNSLDSQVRNLHSDVVQWLCGHYFREAVKMPFVIEWSGVGKLFSNFGVEGVISHPESHGALAELAPLLLQ